MLQEHEKMFKAAVFNMGKRYAHKKATEKAHETGLYAAASVSKEIFLILNHYWDNVWFVYD